MLKLNYSIASDVASPVTDRSTVWNGGCLFETCQQRSKARSVSDFWLAVQNPVATPPVL